VTNVTLTLTDAHESGYCEKNKHKKNHGHAKHSSQHINLYIMVYKLSDCAGLVMQNGITYTTAW